MAADTGDGICPDTVLRGLKEPVFVVDDERRISFVNDRFLEISRFTHREVIGAEYTMFERIVEDGFGDFQRAVEEVETGALDDVRVELAMCHPEAAPVPRRMPAEARLTPGPAEERSAGVLVVLRNIIVRKEHEEQLRLQNERLAEFADIVSHDLRNPLNIAVGRLELAQETGEREHYEAVERAHDRMKTLIDGLLTLARDGETAMNREPVALAQVVDRCWGNVETTSATLSLGTDATVVADESRLNQLLENLIRNAVEHGGSDVRVRIGDLDGGFFLEDDGAGIPPNDRERVFEAGYSGATAGTGLGLSIVSQVAAAHDWELDVTEGTDGGTRFEFTGVERPIGSVR